MTWTSNISGHVETEAEENAAAAVLQKAAQYVNASSWSFYGTHNTWVLDSEIPVVSGLLEAIEAAKPDESFAGGNKVIDGEDPWTPPSMIITSNVPAKPPYTGKGDVPDGVKLPIETPVPLAGTVPDEVLKAVGVPDISRPVVDASASYPESPPRTDNTFKPEAEFHQDKIVVDTLPDSPKV
jgi:hypothetical protein